MFISEAIAQTASVAAAPATQTSSLMSLLPFLIIIVFMYFFVMRPQIKRQKDMQKLLNGLSIGDEVLTIGGIIGVITAVDTDYITLKINSSTEIKCQRQAVQNVLPQGTFKNI
jgi:preprotein translocase subunit YajC